MLYGFNAAEVFKMALEIEENGRLFYQKAQEKTGDIEVKKFFAGMAIEEEDHKRRFTEMMKELPAEKATVFDPNNETDAYLKMMAGLHVFHSCDAVDACVATVGNEIEALKLAMQFEKDTIVFFAEMQSQAETAQAKEKIGLLIKEEQGHLRKLAQQLKRFI